MHRHALPPDGRHGTRHHSRRARPTDRRGALRSCPHPADQPRRASGLRIVPVQHRHAVRITAVRHTRVGHRPPRHRTDRTALRVAVPRRWRTQLLPGARCSSRLRSDDDADAGLPVRNELHHALRRMARGRPGLQHGEVRDRCSVTRDAATRIHATGNRRGIDGLRRSQ